MLVVEVWTSRVPSACRLSVGSPEASSTMATNEAQVSPAWRRSVCSSEPAAALCDGCAAGASAQPASETTRARRSAREKLPVRWWAAMRGAVMPVPSLAESAHAPRSLPRTGRSQTREAAAPDIRVRDPGPRPILAAVDNDEDVSAGPRLAVLGWDAEFEAAFAPGAERGHRPGRGGAD